MEGEFVRALGNYIEGRQNVPMFLVKVTSVSAATFDGVTHNNDEYLDIRLRTVEDGNTEGLLLIPAVGSWVLIADIGSKNHDYIVLAYEKLDSVSVKIGTTKLEVTASGVKILRGVESLKTVLNDVLTKIKTLQIATTTGPATLVPSELPLIDLLKNRLNQILE